MAAAFIYRSPSAAASTSSCSSSWHDLYVTSTHHSDTTTSISKTEQQQQQPPVTEYHRQITVGRFSNLQLFWTQPLHQQHIIGCQQSGPKQSLVEVSSGSWTTDASQTSEQQSNASHQGDTNESAVSVLAMLLQQLAGSAALFERLAESQHSQSVIILQALHMF